MGVTRGFFCTFLLPATLANLWWMKKNICHTPSQKKMASRDCHALSRVENLMSPVLTFFLYMSHVGFFPRKSSFGADASMHAVFGALNARVHFRKKIKSPISAQKAFFGTQFILYAQTHVIFFHRSVPYNQGNATRPFNPCRLTPLSFTDVKNEILGQNMCVFMSISRVSTK